MKIYLIRHGETDWNRRALYQGTTDVPLNAAGAAQAQALGRALAGVRFHAAYTSPLRRARATADAVVGTRGLAVAVLPELRELSYGLWQGRGSGGRLSAGLEWRWRHDPWSVRFPGGETLDEVRRRAAPTLDGIAAAHPAETVLVSGHGHLNRVLLIHALALSRESFWQIEQTNTECWVLDYLPGQPTAGALLAVDAAGVA